MATTPKTFCVSDETINDYGFRLLTDGIDTTAFESNPVMLFMHRRGKVFGGWLNLTKQDGRVLATADFDREDTDKEVTDIIGKVDRGYLKAASMGVTPVEMVWNDALNCYDCVRSVLVEISLVDVGSNRNALCLYSALTGEPMSEVQLAAQLAEIRPSDLTTTTKTTMLNLITLALAAGLAETATEEEVSSTIVGLAADKGYKAKYEALVADQKKEKIKLAAKLIDDAIADKRLAPNMKESYTAMFELSFDHAATILESLVKPVDLVELAKGNNGQANTTTETWETLHKSGQAEALLASNPEQFKKLYKDYYGTDYKV